jgi:predicted metal-binding membrane protein
VPLFTGSYLAVWAVAGIGVYALDRPHGPFAAGKVVVAASVYEFTPLKRHFRRHCRKIVRTGLEFGVYCASSSIGLMLIFVVLGVMSITRMAVIAVLVTFQKLLPAGAAIDVPLASALAGLGIVILADPRTRALM